MNRIDALALTNPRGQLRVRLAAVALAALSLSAVVTPGIRGSLSRALSEARLGKSISAPKFSDPPTDDELLRAGLYGQQLIPVGPTSPDENREIAGLLLEYNEASQCGERDAVQPLAAFVAHHPSSPWTP